MFFLQETEKKAGSVKSQQMFLPIGRPAYRQKHFRVYKAKLHDARSNLSPLKGCPTNKMARLKLSGHFVCSAMVILSQPYTNARHRAALKGETVQKLNRPASISSFPWRTLPHSWRILRFFPRNRQARGSSTGHTSSQRCRNTGNCLQPFVSSE